jgi:hypothetical protein
VLGAGPFIFNIVLGVVPTLVLAGSIAAGIDDDRRHRRMFIFVYGLWAITLAMWNWMRSAPVGWVILWALAGVIGIGLTMARRE